MFHSAFRAAAACRACAGKVPGMPRSVGYLGSTQSHTAQGHLYTVHPELESGAPPLRFRVVHLSTSNKLLLRHAWNISGGE